LSNLVENCASNKYKLKNNSLSKLKVTQPDSCELPTDLLNRPLQEIIIEVIRHCDFEMDVPPSQSAIATGGNDEVIARKAIQEIRAEIEALKSLAAKRIEIKIDKKKPKDLGLQHYLFETLLRISSTGLNAYMVGPAGSGKTTAAVNVAKAMDIPFYFTGAIASEFKLTGFIDANGNVVNTEFRRAYEHGGLFLFDEIDASYPQAVLAFNAALANDYMDFPDKRVDRHKDFYCIAAANTYGQGADRQYVGRNQLDAASLDRFVFLDWRFDEELERALAGNNKWVDFVQDVRKVVEELKIRHVVSPRASIFGVKLLAAGLDLRTVVKLLIWKGLDQSIIDKIRNNINYDLDRFYERGIKI